MLRAYASSTLFRRQCDERIKAGLDTAELDNDNDNESNLIATSYIDHI